MVGGVFFAVEREVIGASIVDLVTAEGFFVLSEAIPGVVFVLGGGDAPEIESRGGGILGFWVVDYLTALGVENHLDEEDGARGEFLIFGVGGSVSVKTGAVAVINKSGGGGGAGGLFGGFSCCWGVGGVGFWRKVIEDIKSGKTRLELVFEMLLVLGDEAIAISERIEQGSQDCDVFGVGGSTDRHALLAGVAPVADLALFNILENGFFGLGEVEEPGVGGVEIVGFFEIEGFDQRSREGKGGLEAEEEGVLFASESF